MKILVVSTHDNRGGAAKAAYRFSKEFIKQGNEVCMYVKDKTLGDSFIRQSPKGKLIGKLFHLLDFLPGFILSGFNKEIPFTLGLLGEDLNSIVEEFKPDIINVHWTWKGFISFPQICKISKKIPVIWTMHDYSPFSGGVYYPNGEGALVKRLAQINSYLRITYLKKSNITFVSPSDFLMKKFKKSKLSGSFKVITINNGVNTNVFKREEKTTAREILGMEKNKKYILFGAINLINNSIKGGEILLSVLKILEKYLIENNIGLIAFGSQNPFKQITLDKRIEKKFVGFIKTDEEMVKILSSADLAVVPSFRENYPFAVLEPLACGTPVVAFNIGGIPEMIKHEENGYLAQAGDINDFIDGIKFCLKNSKKFGNAEYSISSKADSYLSLFYNCFKTGLS